MRIISSVQNDNVKYCEKLKDKAFRRKEQKFILEGKHLVEEALKTDLIEIIMSTDEEYLKSLGDDVETFLVTSTIIAKLSNTKNPQNTCFVWAFDFEILPRNTRPFLYFHFPFDRIFHNETRC